VVNDGAALVSDPVTTAEPFGRSPLEERIDELHGAQLMRRLSPPNFDEDFISE
jgi:hypothetical protein